ncbi:MAG TPA: MFS transporter [Candidatus Corynebacterium gallistercoris]|uniref:MFS transporter n=1 Tax=Candidatus Corynebacterium gallistercoris TaxID=2838530 RepID=A0A9D1RX87_9CORY|nr:MFS transporter [Candidatus Corynebacterium gallistercoris]
MTGQEEFKPAKSANTAGHSIPDAAPALRRWLLLATVGAGVFLITLDNTVLYTALPRLVVDIGASPTQQLWIVNAYPVVIAGLLLGTGTLGDKIGHRRMFIAGMSVFGIASLIAAFAPSPAVLIAARALLAVGAATMMPSTLSLIRLTFRSSKELNLAVGVWASLATISSALGPIIGGALLEVFWWGSVFLLNIPVVVAALALIGFVAPRERTDPTKHWDFPSSLLAMAALVSAVITIKELAHSPQNWPLIATAIVSMLVAGTAFVRRQGRLTQPLITLDIFRAPAFLSGCIGASTALFTIVGLEYITAQRLQLAEGFSPLQAGLVVATIAAGALLTSVLGGAILSRQGVRRLISGGLGVAAVGSLLVIVASLLGATPLLVIAFLLVGVGLGGTMSVASIAMISGAPSHRAGMASSVEEVSYEFGALTAVALLGSVVNAVYAATVVVPAGVSAHAGESLQDAAQVSHHLPEALGSELIGNAGEAYALATAATMAIVVVVLAAASLYTGRILKGVRVELED